jgi:hypothetical protein
MKEIDAMIEAVNKLVANRHEVRQEILSDVLADCQSEWVQNIQAAARAIDRLREISHRANPDTAEIESFLNSLVLRITSAISGVKSYDAIKNTIRNMD